MPTYETRRVTCSECSYDRECHSYPKPYSPFECPTEMVAVEEVTMPNKPTTNFEYVKNMDANEMAYIIAHLLTTIYHRDDPAEKATLKNIVFGWLESEVGINAE